MNQTGASKTNDNQCKDGHTAQRVDESSKVGFFERNREEQVEKTQKQPDTRRRE